VLARAARCFEQLLGERRTQVAQLLAKFETVLETQDPVQIDEARLQFIQWLDALEGESLR
jgi:molecular chaperone HscC